MLIRYLPIGGTWSWRGSSKGQWYHPESEFSTWMRGKGFEVLCGADGRQYVWSTDVNGQNIFSRLFGRKPHIADWLAGGENLYAYLVPPLAPDRQIPGSETHLIVHSHALQPALIAAARGLKINTLISVSSPVREDILEDFGAAARANIGYWIHLHSDRSDRMQWFGELGDGKAGIVREQPLADINRGIPGVGHSDVLLERAHFVKAWSPCLDLIRRRHGRPDFLTPRATEARVDRR